MIAQSYDGTENEALQESALFMGNAAVYAVMILVKQQLPKRPKEIVELVTLLAGAAPAGGADYAGAVISAICEGLPNLTVPKNPHAWVSAGTSYGGSTYAQDRLTPGLLAELIRAMEGLGNAAAAEKFVPVLKANPVIFDPLLILAPALEELLKGSRGGKASFFSARPIWKHTAEKLLERSHAPPEPPEDWSLAMQLACSCADCRTLQAFSIHPEERTHRFRMNKDRRMHLHRKIEAHGLDMTHITERKGSPQMLVCQKTRRRFELRTAQYQADLAACAVLVKLAAAAGTHEPPLRKQLQSVEKTPGSF